MAERSPRRQKSNCVGAWNCAIWTQGNGSWVQMWAYNVFFLFFLHRNSLTFGWNWTWNWLICQSLFEKAKISSMNFNGYFALRGKKDSKRSGKKKGLQQIVGWKAYVWTSLNLFENVAEKKVSVFSFYPDKAWQKKVCQTFHRQILNLRTKSWSLETRRKKISGSLKGFGIGSNTKINQ